jgi:hypothetical protein
MRRIAILLLAGLAICAACSPNVKPPAGRWIGVYDSGGVMVDARLEILPDGTVRVSAPDILGAVDISEGERLALHARLATELDETWGEAKPRQMEFDGRVFRKPGGYASQMEWDPKSKEMILVFYFGMHKSIRIALMPVENFSEDPWRQPSAH